MICACGVLIVIVTLLSPVIVRALGKAEVRFGVLKFFALF